MADYTMCEGLNCPTRDKCYRHTAEPNQQWQAWFIDTPQEIPCKMFLDNSEYG